MRNRGSKDKEHRKRSIGKDIRKIKKNGNNGK